MRRVVDRFRVVVLVSANAEWAPVKEALRPERLERSPYGECFVHAVGDEPVLFLHGGWGKISAAASTDYAISRWQPDVLINIGTCGGIEGRAQRGETILVTRTLAYDIYEAMGDSAEAIRAYTTDVDLSWLDASFPLSVRRVSMVSGDRDLVPSEVPGLVERFGAVAGDWESAAIALCGRPPPDSTADHPSGVGSGEQHARRGDRRAAHVRA
jgi:adenosylhomocysteine nucleosidase